MPASRPRLELVWPGKDQFLLTPSGDDGKPVWVPMDHPAAHEVRLTEFTGAYGQVNDADPYADNLVFTGDSLDVLRILYEVPEHRQHYRGKVKLIYIDPPFNTGQTFEHYDDWMEHSTWLSFLRDRLILMRDLLTPDGSIWVHLDDVEQHRMRCLLDEVFGASNFVATVVWQKKTSRDNRAAFSASQDYLLVYSKRPQWRDVRNRLEDTGDYANPDRDPRGPWRSIPLTAQAGHATASQFYAITSPTGVVHQPPPGRAWTYTRERFDDLVSEGRVYWPKGGNGKPRLKRYPDESIGLVPFTLWPSDEVGENATAVRELRSIFGAGVVFDTPKPERLVQRIIHIGSDPGDIVLDVFGGSGTAAAVAQKMGRRWVTAELSAKTVDQFIVPRLTKVVDGNDPGGITKDVGWEGGGGFRTVIVNPSMYEMTPVGVMLADWATNGKFARAVAGQLGFTFQPDALPLCGVRGRMRLAVLDGAVGPEEIREIVAALGDSERVTVVAKVILPGSVEALVEVSRGSTIKKAPRDLLADHVRRARRVNRSSRRSSVKDVPFEAGDPG